MPRDAKRKPRMGRPLADPKVKLAEALTVRMTKAQRAAFEPEAERAGLSLSAWLVDAGELALARGSTR